MIENITPDVFFSEIEKVKVKKKQQLLDSLFNGVMNTINKNLEKYKQDGFSLGFNTIHHPVSDSEYCYLTDNEINSYFQSKGWGNCRYNRFESRYATDVGEVLICFNKEK